MTTIQHKAIDFLRQYRMDPLDVDFEANVERFLEQMVRGLAGSESCLEMVPTFLEPVREIPVNQRVIVADAGGTHFRVAIVHFDATQKAVIENPQKFSMPATESELSRREFFEVMAKYFREVLGASDRIGFCFSYPAEILPNKDGRLIRFVKEIKAPEVVGELIGQNLNQTIVRMGLGLEKHIVLLNDTVATLLAGVCCGGSDFSSYIGFILGTGTNTCYVESNANITKQKKLDLKKSQIINTESGGMAHAHRGDLDEIYDGSTHNPGVHIFEKMISGAYLGPLFLTTLKRACSDGLLPEAVFDAVEPMDELTTIDMNDFLFNPHGDNRLARVCQKGDASDTELAHTLADRLVERAAKLTAINLAAMAIKSAQGTGPAGPICIVAEGTTFYQMKDLKSRVESYLKQNLEDRCGICTRIIGVENAAIIGAAIAGLTN